jgi:hypothetical protein
MFKLTARERLRRRIPGGGLKDGPRGDGVELGPGNTFARRHGRTVQESRSEAMSQMRADVVVAIVDALAGIRAPARVSLATTRQWS